MTATAIYIEPLDVLYLRGNKLFADAGAHGEASMPPWPSVAAGAIRSRLMADGATLESLAHFRLSRFGLARRTAEGSTEILWPLPADIVVTSDALDDARYLRPQALPAAIACSQPLPKLPMLLAEKPGKPVGGLWLNGAGIRAWLAGAPIRPAHLLRAGELWQTDSRLGIALDAQKGSAADGRLYTTECIALQPDTGFVAEWAGAAALPDHSLLRLGGDGRGARATAARIATPQPDWQRIAESGRFRVTLTTPGLFAGGWQPDGVPATLVAAAVGRHQTVSGWDIRTGSNRPKPARRVVPTGSVYWYEGFAGDLGELQALAENGIAPPDPERRAEGFGKLAIAPWAD